MSCTWDKVYYERVEKGVWVKFHRVELEEFNHFENIDTEIKTACV